MWFSLNSFCFWINGLWQQSKQNPLDRSNRTDRIPKNEVEKELFDVTTPVQFEGQEEKKEGLFRSQR